MAEGGGEEELENPFSFKTYVKKKAKKQDQDTQPDDIFAVTGPTGPRKKEKSSLVVADDDDVALPSSSSKKKGSNENPFSFKKFISSQGEASAARKSTPADLAQNDVSERSPNQSFSASCSSSDGAQSQSKTPQSTAPPDFASDLPDFISNHFGSEHLQENSQRHQLPDFTLPVEKERENRVTRDSLLGLSCSRNGDHGSEVAHTSWDDEEEEEEAGSVQHGRHFEGISLPDFLVDSAVPGVVQVQSVNGVAGEETGYGASGTRMPAVHEPQQETKRPGSLRNSRESSVTDESSVRQLREENSQLRAVVAQMAQKATDEDARVAVLEKELRRLQKKEAEETAVMERAVQQVEENLVATTRRAVQAETQVAKLKQDIKILQAQMKVLSAENEALRSEDHGLSDIRERTKYASEQLKTAAVTAETNLKELLSGVEKLKVLGQILSSLEKVTDAQEPSSEDSHTTGT